MAHNAEVAWHARLRLSGVQRGSCVGRNAIAWRATRKLYGAQRGTCVACIGKLPSVKRGSSMMRIAEIALTHDRCVCVFVCVCVKQLRYVSTLFRIGFWAGFSSRGEMVIFLRSQRGR